MGASWPTATAATVSSCHPDETGWGRSRTVGQKRGREGVKARWRDASSLLSFKPKGRLPALLPSSLSAPPLTRHSVTLQRQLVTS
ncbi:hypothetical protein NDU88_001482 [Pleurodeles waltl]|uniref:Secreted protein n=1 Tax=Pleurodeles waltl TaxID=8319 RepID=A0AAV7KQF0_PLEWA|nr:hypothetical protein NDU88_001482 [Pleurodeles waltl]